MPLRLSAPIGRSLRRCTEASRTRSNGPMDQLLQHLLNALILGGTYALLGIGLTLIFGIMRVVNFAHGELYAFGAYMMYLWVMVLGANFYLALPLAVVLGVALGALIELVLLRRLQGADIDTTMLVMIGAWIALQNMEQLTWSRRRQVDQHAVPVCAAGAGPGLGLLEPRCSCSSSRWR